MNDASESGILRTRVPVRSLLALGILIAGFCVSLYILVGSPNRVRAAGSTSLSAENASSGTQASQSENSTASPATPQPQPPTVSSSAENSPTRFRHVVSAQAPVTAVSEPLPIASQTDAGASAKLDQAQVESGRGFGRAQAIAGKHGAGESGPAQNAPGMRALPDRIFRDCYCSCHPGLFAASWLEPKIPGIAAEGRSHRRPAKAASRLPGRS